MKAKNCLLRHLFNNFCWQLEYQSKTTGQKTCKQARKLMKAENCLLRHLFNNFCWQLEYQSKIIAQKTCKQTRILMKAERNYKKASVFFERILSQFEHNCRVKSIGKKIEGLACARKFHRGQDSGRS